MEAFLRILLYLTPVWITPNGLTWTRLAAVPILLALYAFNPFWALVPFVWGCFTDWYDGELARRRGLMTPEGKLLDERVDKAFIYGTMVPLVASDTVAFGASWVFWGLVFILFRDALVVGMRMRWPAKALRIPSLPSAKWKTFILMLGLGFLLVAHPSTMGSWYFSLIGFVFVGVAASLALWSGGHYAWLFVRTK